MKLLWCWRCGKEMPMLDEQEYTQASRLFGECATATKEFRQHRHVPLDSAISERDFRPIRDWHKQLTGADCHRDAIMHHRLASLGDPCRICGKPLRSPRAKMRAACGAPAVSKS
jgi:DNA-directed RNA polymerase subunit RPC12/RpoP